MRVTYLNPTGQLGGAERSLLDLLASFREAQGDWPLSLVLGSRGPLMRRAEALGVSVKVLAFPRAFARLGEFGVAGPSQKAFAKLLLMAKLCWSIPGLISYIRRLRHHLETLHPDLIYTNGFKMHLLGLWARPRGVPIIWHLHDYVTPRPFMSRLLGLHSSRCAAIIANSRSVAEDAQAFCPRNGNIHVLYNGVDLASFSPEGPVLDLDALAGLGPAEPGTIKVGLLGTFARWKGHEVFLKALSLLPKGLPVRGYIIGRPLYLTENSQYRLEELQDSATQLNVSDKVAFAGFVENPAAALRALDIVVHTSTQPEPFGLVIVEAMACGRPVLVSRAGGAEEIIEEGVNALGYPPGDAQALADRIVQLARDPNLRRALGEGGRATAERRFGTPRLAGESIPLYQKAILDSKSAHPSPP